MGRTMGLPLLQPSLSVCFYLVAQRVRSYMVYRSLGRPWSRLCCGSFSWETRYLQLSWWAVILCGPHQGLLIGVESCGGSSPSFIKATRPCVHDPDVAPAWGGLLAGGMSCTLLQV